MFADLCLENVSIRNEKSIKYRRFPFDNFGDCETFRELDGPKALDDLSSYTLRPLKETFLA